MGLLSRFRPRLGVTRAVGDDPGNGRRVVSVDYRDQRPTAGGQQALGINSFYLLNHNFGLLGSVKWGEKSSTRYAGDLGPLQRYSRGVNSVGNAASIRPGLSRGLPATSTVPGQPAGDMLGLLIRNRRFDKLGS